MNKIKNLKQKGFTLIEILLVIGFIAGAMVVAFITYPKVQATNRANLENQHLQAIAGGIKNLYSTTGNYIGLTTRAVIQANINPDDMLVDRSAWTIDNQWGGTVATVVDPVSNKLFNVTYTNVPDNECTKLVSGAATNFIRVRVDGTLMKDHSPGVATRVNIDPAAVAAQCGNNSGVHALIFTSN